MARMLLLLLALLVGCAKSQITVRGSATSHPGKEPEATATVEYQVHF